MHRAFEKDGIYLECIRCHKMINIGTYEEYTKLRKQIGGSISVIMCQSCRQARELNKKEDKK